MNLKVNNLLQKEQNNSLDICNFETQMSGAFKCLPGTIGEKVRSQCFRPVPS